MIKFLSSGELNSVAYLSSVRKAVYMMQCIDDKNLYRFGGIGAIEGNANTPIRRLGQCSESSNGSIDCQWTYIAMALCHVEKSGQDIRNLEKLIRNYLFINPGNLKDDRILRRDLFSTEVQKNKIIEQFKKALINSA